MIIAIDGPSGAGKSTVAKAVAKKLGFSCLSWSAVQAGEEEEGYWRNVSCGCMEGFAGRDLPY